MKRLTNLVAVKPEEAAAVAWAAGYFFCLLCSYYVLRPVRDEMGITGGVEYLQWVFTGTFVVMLLAVPLFGAAAKRFSRHTLLPVVYGFFIFNLLIFFLLFRSDIATVYVARAFFIWVSVFNLFVVSVFWSFMADLFDNAQARRLFALIAAGGSAGALAGPTLTAVLAPHIGPVNLLLLSALLLGAALLCVQRLLAWARHAGHTTAALPVDDDAALGGTVLAGLRLMLRSPYLLGIGLYILLYTTLSTFLYFEQAHIVRAAFADSASRTTVFALIDLAVNVLTVTMQLLVTHRLVARFGLPATLALVPGMMLIGFAALGVAPLLTILLAFQILRRAGNYAVAKPAREMLFTVVSREEKYKAKNVLDTVVYRGGDAVSGWVFAGLTGLGLGLAQIAFIAVPIAGLWLGVGVWLGRQQDRVRTTPSTAATNEAS